MNSARRYLVLTPFNHTKMIAAVSKLRGIEAVAVSTSSGVALVRELPVPEFADWDISELLGSSPAPEIDTLDGSGDTPESEPTELSDSPELVASLFSELSPYGVVLITADLGDDIGTESGTSGMVNAVRFLNGRRGEDIPAGLLLNSLDPIIEALILGEEKAADLPGAITEMTLAEVEAVMASLSADGGEADA
ncbi:hypothetical protein JTE88_04995 [Arcanobacterium phocisimile]|uniref:Uncharacterized protein n=1 Tax=Arcanobacterium phocisimile TaxID=1302235 RepID=A0ABX7IET8_9ACTO|nr:hypothetical protein [Arcanobacterium phocisimile]QRV01472.1 hypothetical protein JTE88_04995 [Arcanobacterium phocisimile]